MLIKRVKLKTCIFHTACFDKYQMWHSYSLGEQCERGKYHHQHMNTECHWGSTYSLSLFDWFEELFFFFFAPSVTWGKKWLSRTKIFLSKKKKKKLTPASSHIWIIPECWDCLAIPVLHHPGEYLPKSSWLTDSSRTGHFGRGLPKTISWSRALWSTWRPRTVSVSSRWSAGLLTRTQSWWPPCSWPVWGSAWSPTASQTRWGRCTGPGQTTSHGLGFSMSSSLQQRSHAFSTTPNSLDSHSLAVSIHTDVAWLTLTHAILASASYQLHLANFY